MKPPKLPGEHVDDTRDEFAVELRAILNDQQLQDYLAVDGPLRTSDLPAEITQREGFKLFVDQYGWPNDANAGSIVPTREAMYDDAQDFWHHMYVYGDKSKFLNNFKNWLVTLPVDDPHNKSLTARVYGTQPALARAHIVAEPLFQVLRAAVSQRGDLPIGEVDAARIAEAYPDVPKAAFAAYRLLGKLLTQDDEKLVLRELGFSGRGKVIKDAHAYLWQ